MPPLFRKKEDRWFDGDIKVEWRPKYNDWRHDAANSGKTVDQYLQSWINPGNDTIIGIPVFDNDGTWDRVKARLGDIDHFALRLEINQSVSISGKKIHTLELARDAPVVLKDCTIKNLILTQDHPRNLRLERCKIKILRLNRDSVATFEMINCSVEKIFAPAPTGSSPFTGSVEIRDSKFSSAFENAQAYRNLRHHLTTLHNHEAASVFHAAEMRAEVGRQSLVDKLISVIYSSLSNYGGSSARPFVLFIALLILNTAFLYLCNGAVTIGESSEADGWRYSLYGLDERAKLLQAAVFAFSQCFNPLGVFGTRLLLSGRTPIIAFTSALLGILCTLTLTLFVLAVRRRFRLDRS